MKSTASAKMNLCAQRILYGAVLSTWCELIGYIWLSQLFSKEVSMSSTKWLFTRSAGSPTHIYAPSAVLNSSTFSNSIHKSCHLY